MSNNISKPLLQVTPAPPEVVAALTAPAPTAPPGLACQVKADLGAAHLVLLASQAAARPVPRPLARADHHRAATRPLRPRDVVAELEAVGEEVSLVLATSPASYQNNLMASVTC